MHRKARFFMHSFGAVMVLLSASSCAVAQSDNDDEPDGPAINPGGDGSNDGSGGNSDFSYYLSLTTPPSEARQGRDWSGMLEFDTSVMSREFVIIYQQHAGNYPTQGPHIAQRPGYMEAHLRKLDADVRKMIPDPNYSGYAILDYESFPAIWDRAWNRPSNLGPDAHDKDLRDDWTDHIRSQHPRFDGMSDDEKEQLLRETWERAVRDLFLASLNTARAARPNAKWGFYGYPYRFFSLRREVPQGVISYGDGSHNGSLLNDRLQWMWDSVDVVAPSVYAQRIVLDENGPCQRDVCTAAEDLAYIQNMIGEAKRVAGDKPVLAFMSAYYNLPHDDCFEGEELNEANLWNQIVGPALAGADGAALWGHIENRADHDRWQSFLDRRIMPLMEEGMSMRGGSGRGASDDNPGELDEMQNPTAVSGKGLGGAAARNGGVVSRYVDGPADDDGPVRRQPRSIRFNPATDRISTRIEPVRADARIVRPSASARLSAVRYNPATDRMSKPGEIFEKAERESDSKD